jgi:hypothetical protein
MEIFFLKKKELHKLIIRTFFYRLSNHDVTEYVFKNDLGILIKTSYFQFNIIIIFYIILAYLVHHIKYCLYDFDHFFNH